jgi:CheY-like chemotaxis protein
VLVVDDDAEIRAFLVNQLEGEGLTVRTAENGSEALHMVGQEVPDVILLDLMMPVMDGTTFLSKLRERSEWASLPVIVLTGRDLSEDERMELSQLTAQIISKGDTAGTQMKIALGAFLGVEE